MSKLTITVIIFNDCRKNKGDDLKTIFDDPAPEPTPSDGIPTKGKPDVIT